MAQHVLSFSQSTHAGLVEGTGALAGVEFVEISSATATLSFSEGVLDRAWNNNSVDATVVEVEGNSGSSRDSISAGSVRMYNTQSDAILMVFKNGDVRWSYDGPGGSLEPVAPGKTALTDRNPLIRDGERPSVGLQEASVWRSDADGRIILQGDFLVSLYGWNLRFDNGHSFTAGAETTVGGEPVQLQTTSSAWLMVKDATLTLDVYEGGVRNSFVHSPTITTDGTATLVGLPLGQDKTYTGITTLAADTSGDHLEGTLREGAIGSAPGAAPSSTSVFAPSGSAWMWGAGGAALLVAAFVAAALLTRSVPMLEWRSYHALDEHRPLRASVWARLWSRRDPWDGHAWAARGESHMMMGQNRRAAKHFTSAHALLPVDERAINALHAARAHARGGRAPEAAHWIGIVASLDLNVLLSAREEPDFARVWNDAVVQKTVQQVLGVGA